MLYRLALGCALSVALVCAFEPLRIDDPIHVPKGFPRPKIPASNPMSTSKVKLGRYLFYDTRLSVNQTQSCASCHRQELAFTDGRETAMGATGESHPRSSMSLVNVVYNSVLTWSDPGMRSLEAQAMVPLFSDHPVELGLKGRESKVLASLRAEPVYDALFPQAFPGESDAFTIANVAKAIAAFERTIVSARSPYDRYHYGNDPDAVSDAVKRGEGLFFTDGIAGCFRCHSGFNFSDATDYAGAPPHALQYHNTALYNLPGAFSYPRTSLGTYEHTRRRADVGKFKTPTLRNIALTAPYMHDGSIATLEAVLDHYAEGGRTIAEGPNAGRGHDNPHRDARMTGFTLTRQNRDDLLAFLRSLTDDELIRDPRFTNPWLPGALALAPPRRGP